MHSLVAMVSFKHYLSRIPKKPKETYAATKKVRKPWKFEKVFLDLSTFVWFLNFFQNIMHGTVNSFIPITARLRESWSLNSGFPEG